MMYVTDQPLPSPHKKKNNPGDATDLDARLEYIIISKSLYHR